MQVVRTRPDIEKDQRPEMDDRQFVAIDRAARLFRHKVIHHAQKPGGQEETHRVVPVPPLRHRILHACKDLHRFRAPDRHGDGKVVDHMQHRHSDDEGQKEPVGDIDMALAPLQNRAKEHGEVSQPNDGQPDVDVPFRLGIFLGLGGP